MSATPPTTDGHAPVRLVRRDDVLERTLLDGVLVLAPGQADPTALRGSAAVLWDLLRRPSTTDELLEHLAARYTGERATMADDVTGAVAELGRLGLVVADVG